MKKRSIFFSGVLSLLLLSCEKNNSQPVSGDIDFRQEMRQLVQSISAYGRSIDTDFIIIPQNGSDIITIDGEPEGPIASGYINAIDGIGQEELFYGYDNRDNQPTPSGETAFMLPFLNLLQQSGKTILVTDYTSDTIQIDEATSQNSNRGFIPFAAPNRNLSIIPEPALQAVTNGKDIDELSDAESFLYLINPEEFTDKNDFLKRLAETNYDMLLIDLFFNDKDAPLTALDLQKLQLKPDGKRRLVIAYMSIGEAESYRYYWQPEWNTAVPYWMEAENPDWEGNYKVRYWEQDWKDLLFGNKDSYLKKIIDVGFDGVYLDIIDGYEYFE